MTSAALRRERLRALLAARDLPAALVTSLVNVRYLTGFSSSNAALLVTADDAVLATDGRYVTQAGQEAPDVELLVDRACAAALLDRAAASGVGRVGVEEHVVTLELDAQLAAAAPAVERRPLARAVEDLRTVKDEDELARLREACAVSDRALAAVLPAIRPGRTERSVARQLESAMVDLGAEAPAFDTIVGAGPNSAVPHHRPTGRALEPGDFLVIDFGARVRGYHADMTRTFVVGAPPAGWQAEIHELVRSAQQAGRDALSPGADILDVDRAARSVVEDAGCGEAFPHGLGHGVGLQIHEAPLMVRGATGILSAHVPLTVEPGVYLPGQGGVRIEDILVVRDAAAGGPELLTTTTRELLVLG